MARTRSEETVRLTGSANRETVDADRVAVTGSATVHGPVVAGELTVAGSLDVRGRLDAEAAAVDGSATTGGDARAGTLELDGSGSFGGDLSVDDLDADGTTTVDGHMDAHEIGADGSTAVGGTLVANEAAFDGSVSVDGPTEVTELTVDGAGSFGDLGAEEFAVEGALQAEVVDAERFRLDLGGDSTVRTLRGREIEVGRAEAADGLLGALLGGGDPRLTVDVVEGDTVDLDATDAGTVAAPTVALGPAARVDVVYADDLDAADGATVGDVRDYDEYDGGEVPAGGQREDSDIEPVE